MKTLVVCLMIIGSSLVLEGCARLGKQWRGEYVSPYNNKELLDAGGSTVWAQYPGAAQSVSGPPYIGGFFYNELIIQNKNDLYYRKSKENPPRHIYEFEDRPLTHTPDIKESDIRVWLKSGAITYFEPGANGGKWYMQPIGGDDTNRQEISAEAVMKMGQ